MSLVFNMVMGIVDIYALVLAAKKKTAGRILAVFFLTTACALTLALAINSATQGGIFGFLLLAGHFAFMHAPGLLAGLSAQAWKVCRPLSFAGILLCVLTLAVAYDGFLVEPNALDVNTHKIVSSKITKPFRIAVVAETHYENFREQEKKVWRVVAEHAPDLVVLLGDYIQTTESNTYRYLTNEVNRFLREEGFSSPAGAFAVEGNHEFTSWPRIFDGLAVKTFTQTATAFGTVAGQTIAITGLSEEDAENSQTHVSGTADFHVVLGHSPNFALGEIEADLLLAAGTHGGQVQLPFTGPLLTFAEIPRSWADGRTTLKTGKVLIVSRGIGIERGIAPALRFLARPEILLIDVVPA